MEEVIKSSCKIWLFYHMNVVVNFLKKSVDSDGKMERKEGGWWNASMWCG